MPEPHADTFAKQIDGELKPPASHARNLANVPREVKRHREAGLPEFSPEGQIDEDHCAGCAGSESHDDLVMTNDKLAYIVHLALSVGRGTEPTAKLSAMLEPYGIRRKS